ncbi:MAG: hypothetical protein V3U07_05150, partial [Nitrospirales bacterium]
MKAKLFEQTSFSVGSLSSRRARDYVSLPTAFLHDWPKHIADYPVRDFPLVGRSFSSKEKNHCREHQSWKF